MHCESEGVREKEGRKKTLEKEIEGIMRWGEGKGVGSGEGVGG